MILSNLNFVNVNKSKGYIHSGKSVLWKKVKRATYRLNALHDHNYTIRFYLRDYQINPVTILCKIKVFNNTVIGRQHFDLRNTSPLRPRARPTNPTATVSG